jgi:multiple sugar transport system substrate-binding protein
MRNRTRAVGVLLAAGILVLSACGGGGSGESDNTITMWTLEDVQSRIEKTRQIAEEYTKKTGTKVQVVAVAEDQFSQLITSSAAAGDLPDVVAALPLSSVADLGNNDLLDTDAAESVVDSLGRDTFNQRALSLTQDPEGQQLAVPSDGWAQLLFYRKDLFQQAGLQPPSTFADIEAAAKALDSPELDGITAATAPDDSFTQQTFEHLALANGCQLTSQSGQVTLDSPQCVETFGYYTGLMNRYGPSGLQTVDTTRASYLAGKAAMVIWSSFLLDELSGLRSDTPPTCAECRKDPSFLADNTGVVSTLQGPSGTQPAQYGEIASWTILDGASESTSDFVKYMMDDAYVDWLSLAPEGKVPVREGTPQDPTKFVDAWPSLTTGETEQAPLRSLYDQQTLESVLHSPDTFQRWGFEQGRGALAGAMLSELPVPEALSESLAGDLTPQEAAQQAQDDVQRIAESVG